MIVAREMACRFHSKLTPRELDVLGLVAEGLSSKEIAQNLKIAPSTVESHLESAKSKLGARSRPNLVARAIGYGLVAPVIEMEADRTEPDLVLVLPSAPATREIEGPQRTALAATVTALIAP